MVSERDGASTQPARWYHLEDEEQRGPIGLEAMRQLVLDGRVVPDTYVWADGMPDWLPARMVPAIVPPDDVRGRLVAWP